MTLLLKALELVTKDFSVWSLGAQVSHDKSVSGYLFQTKP